MGSFIKKIIADNRTIEFSFMRVFSVEGPRFLVTTVDGNKALLFQMVFLDGQWGIKEGQKVPDWIYKIEPQLTRAITESNPLFK